MEKVKVLMALMGLEIGGAETHVLELCKALAKRDVQVIVVSNGGAYVKELEEFGIKHYLAPLHNKKPVSLLKSFFILKKVIASNNIKLVHAHARIPAFLCGVLSKSMGFRFVTTAHWLFTTRFPFNVLTNWGEGTLAVSEDIKTYLIEKYNLPPNNILVTINGIDTEKFSPDQNVGGIYEELGLDPQKRNIVYISRMDKDRSLAAHRLISCASEIFEQYKDIQIIVVGGGNDFGEIKKAADKANAKIGEKVIYLTGSRVDINKFLALADIFVGVSRAALEAMAAAKPLIVAGNEGYLGIFSEEKLDDGINTNFCCRGFVETTSSQLKADILELLGKSKAELTAMGEYGREIIIKYYSVDRMAEDALRLYRSIERGGERSIDVMLSGYYGYYNNGDDMVLRAIVDDLKLENKDIKITVLSRRPKSTMLTYDVNSIHRFDFLKILHALPKTKLLISGGGSLIQDVTSTHSLIYYLAVIYFAKRRGAKVMLYSNGIGPVNNPKNRKRVESVLNSADLITLRDEPSFQYVQSLGVTKPPIKITSDTVFSIENQRLEEMGAEVLTRIGCYHKKYFVVSIRSWKSIPNGFEQTIADFGDYIFEKYGYTAIFVPMQPENDSDISQRVIKLMKHPGIFFGSEYGFWEAMAVIAGAQFVLGMRLHALIYAIKTGCPIIGLIYDKKIKSMVDATGQYFYELIELISLERLIGFADEIIEKRETISQCLIEKSMEFKRQSRENASHAVELINGVQVTR